LRQRRCWDWASGVLRLKTRVTETSTISPALEIVDFFGNYSHINRTGIVTITASKQVINPAPDGRAISPTLTIAWSQSADIVYGTPFSAT
jgi:hypothetical protein